jgi:hypothetical protein
VPRCDRSVYRAAFFGQVFDFIPLLLSPGISALRISDMFQRKLSLRRNYPILANIRFALEEVRPGDPAIFH